MVKFSSFKVELNSTVYDIVTTFTWLVCQEKFSCKIFGQILNVSVTATTKKFELMTRDQGELSKSKETDMQHGIRSRN